MTTRRVRSPFAGDILARIGLVMIALILLVCVVGLVVPGLDGTSSVAPRS